MDKSVKGQRVNTDPLSSVLRDNASVEVPDVDHAGGLNPAEILAWRDWFVMTRPCLDCPDLPTVPPPQT